MDTVLTLKMTAIVYLTSVFYMTLTIFPEIMSYNRSRGRKLMFGARYVLFMCFTWPVFLLRKEGGMADRNEA